MIRHFGKEYYWDPSAINELVTDPNYNVHDLVGAIQALSLTLVLNPTTLRRVYHDNRGLGAGKRKVHCTGHHRVSLIHQARRKFADGGEDIEDIEDILAVCNQLEWLWRETSARGRTHSEINRETLLL